MNTEQNTLPLWKKLNEKRTQGVIECRKLEHHKMYALYVGGDKSFIGKLYDKQSENDSLTNDEAEANAKYTALAFNNFAAVAEALEELMNLPLTVKSGSDKVYGKFNEAREKAKQVLNNI